MVRVQSVSPHEQDASHWTISSDRGNCTLTGTRLLAAHVLRTILLKVTKRRTVVAANDM